MDKKEEQLQNKLEEKHISICDVMKGDTSEIIQKLESNVPSLVQNYSDLYTAYLHMFDDLFGTCYMAEKEFFDKLNIDQETLKKIKRNSDMMKNQYLNNIDMTAKFFDVYVQMRISAVKSFDTYMHTMMDSYAKTLSQFNQSMNSSK
jgi:acetate kinase